MRVHCTVDGRAYDVEDVPAGESLLGLLRERLGRTATKNACEQGACGSCTVLLDGVAVCSCLVAAGQADGREIRTVEAVADDEVQEALLDAGAVQCGFCTPGFVVSIRDLLTRQPHPTDAEIRAGLAGNLCRCTGYAAIVDAVRRVGAR